MAEGKTMEEVPDQGIERVLIQLKQKKSRCKANFTRYRNRLRENCEEDEIDVMNLKSMFDKCEGAFGELMECIDSIIQTLLDRKTVDMQQVQHHQNEISVAEEQFESTSSLYHETRMELKSMSSVDKPPVKNSEVTLDIGKDMWKQLQKVSIPIFDGQIKSYEPWKMAFMSCVDAAPATKEYKLLQMRQYLRGSALSCVEGLGHSAEAYDMAKNRLERKFGGHRRRISHYLEQIEKVPPVNQRNPKGLEKFADILDMTVHNMKTAGLESELSNGMLYMTIQRKLPEQMLASYHRWLEDQLEDECVESLKCFVLRESEFYTIANETIHGIEQTSLKGERTYLAEGPTIEEVNITRLCRLCQQGNHPIWGCEKFKQLPVKERWEKAKELKLCYRCLKFGHRGSVCRNTRECGIDKCVKLHNRMLHNRYEQTRHTLNPEAAVYNVTSRSENFIALRTVPVLLQSGDKRVQVNALLDDGSTKTYVNTEIAVALGLEGPTKTVSVSVLNGQSRQFTTMPVTCELLSVDERHCSVINAFTTEKVTGNARVMDWNEQSNKYEHLRGISFPHVQTSRPIVDILIGVDHPELHRCIQEVFGKPGEPCARLGPLGWTCIGGTNDLCGDNTMFMTYFSQDSVGNELRRFWEIETVPYEKSSEPILSELDKKIMSDTESSLTFIEGRCEVSIPWKQNRELPDNYTMALKRLKQTEKKLDKLPEVKEVYHSTVEKYINKGYISKVDPSEDSVKAGYRWYLPHFPIIRPEKDTTKVRIVFDASARYEDISLNDVIHEGPKLQNDLVSVLLRFRQYPVALVCDISEMFLQISLKSEDRPFHRFLLNSSSDPPDEYQFNRLVFGVNASPFLAQLVSRKTAETFHDEFPRAAETITDSTYMDDSMDSVMTDELGLQLHQELSALWKKAGMCAKKWFSNSTALLENIPVEDRASEVDLDSGVLPMKKVLGVHWHADCDSLTFKGNPVSLTDNCTKRFVLKVIARLFDPLGLVSPYIIRGKIFLQKLWCDGYDWDETVSPELKQSISRWLSNVVDLNDLRVNRCLNFSPDVVASSIHVFSDASELAYGAVVYVRHETTDSNIDTQFVCAKTHVAPLKATSIPRLELMAAVLGTRLVQTVVKALKLHINNVTFWSDSTDVLWWIHRESRSFKPFVANRVGEIHGASSPQQWRYVPTGENPADIASRGSSAEDLVKNKLWWEGPEFLRQSEDRWPKCIVRESVRCLSEQKKDCQKADEFCAFSAVGNSDEFIRPENYSSWRRISRILAWTIRFIENMRLKVESRKQGELTSDEIRVAELILIRRAQVEKFASESKCLTQGRQLPTNSKLLRLNPKLDDDGVLRCDSRLRFAKFMSYDSRFPIILPRNSWVTKLIVKHHHELNQHGGTNQVLSSVSTRFWIEAAREEIREWERDCNHCRRRKTLPAGQIMSSLPDSRLSMPSRAFANTAVDYAGPFVTIQGRGKRREKRYLCLFTCMGCRAVHLEMAYGLDTSSFMNCFYRFTSRRGLPNRVYSDNGTNFIGADRELKDLLSALDNNKIVKSCANKGIIWEFNPPSAPHFGGVHEAMIKSAKRAINKILKNADVTDEELATAFVGAEGLLNSRPLTYQSAHPSDDAVLTPNHFLHGQLGGEFAPSSVDTTSFDIRKRWRYVQELVKHIWHRWIREFLPTLSCRKKWFRTRADFKVGDVVLVVDPDSPRGHWPLGRILEVFPGRDGHVRVVRVQVGHTTFRRPITRLCPLECDNA